MTPLSLIDVTTKNDRYTTHYKRGLFFTIIKSKYLRSDELSDWCKESPLDGLVDQNPISAGAYFLEERARDTPSGAMEYVLRKLLMVVLLEGVANHKFNANSFKIKRGPPVKRYALWETVAFLFFYLRKKLPSGQVGSSRTMLHC